MHDAPDWNAIDKWLMGEAFVGSRLAERLNHLCEGIGARWAGAPADAEAANYVRDCFEESGLRNARIEPFDLRGWDFSACEGRIVEDDRAITLLPMMHCPPLSLRAPIVYAGFGMPHEIEALSNRLRGAVGVIENADEPFTTPVPVPERLRALAEAGCVAAVAIEARPGGHIEIIRATDKRWNERAGDVLPHPLPTLQTHREDGGRLRRAAGKTLEARVESSAFTIESGNAVAELPGEAWPRESLVLGAHIDTYRDSPGAVDDGSGLVVALEVMRLLALARRELGVAPGMTIRVCAWSGEEQNHQGSAAYVRDHHGPEPHPRLVLNLDELSAGSMKGVVLQFPQLRALVQEALDGLGEDMRCHVLPTLDHMNDGFSFTRSAIPAAILWRWRFVGRRPDSNYRAEAWDTPDKVDVRELKEYVGYIARLLLRLSHMPPERWPLNTQTVERVEARLKREIGGVGRTM